MLRLEDDLIVLHDFRPRRPVPHAGFLGHPVRDGPCEVEDLPSVDVIVINHFSDRALLHDASGLPMGEKAADATVPPTPATH